MPAIPRLDGKVSLVTGANTGIGRVTAAELARSGAHVFLACRSPDKTAPVVEQIRRETGSDRVEFLPLDLASLSSVRACADAFLRRDLPLHLLINNAGLAGQRGLTADGFELAFGVNHLGHFLLTHLLLDRLRASAPEPLFAHEYLFAMNSFVMVGSSGKLYFLDLRGQSRVVSSESSPITLLRTAPDGRTFVTGTNDGTVRLYRDGISVQPLLKAGGPIRDLAIWQPMAHDGFILVVVSEDGQIHLRTKERASPPAWQTMAVSARSVAISPDGQILAVTCSDGSVWYYLFSQNYWVSTRPHLTDVYSGRFSPDGKNFVSSDGSGTVILHDVLRLKTHNLLDKLSGEQQ